MTTQTAEIIVRYVNYPVPPKKRGSIKSADGMAFWCAPEMLRMFQEKEMCTIEYETNEQGFHQLKRKVGSSNGAATAQAAQPAPIVQTHPPGSLASLATNLPRANGKDTLPSLEQQFVQNLFHPEMIGYSQTELIEFVNRLRETWRQTLGQDQ